jgi:SMI1-KNR4 cell-wall
MEIIDKIYIKHINTRFSLPDESSVDMIESRIGNVLPQSYRRFLLDYNGGFFDEPNIVSIGSRSPYDKLTCLYGIGATHICAELEKSIDILDDNYPAIVLPIGDTLMGSLIIMLLDEEYSGQIVVTVHGPCAFGLIL